MEELTRILDLIEKRRQLFIGDEGIWALKHFIDGYCVCLNENGIDVNAQLEEFDTFVFNKFQLEKSPASLWAVIDENAVSNDDAYNMFFTLWHEYSAS